MDRTRIDTARYIALMLAEMEAIAGKAGLDRLAYFLGMASAEADLTVRTEKGDVGSLSDVTVGID